MEKRAFLNVLSFIRKKPWLIAGMIAAMLVLRFGEQALSTVLLEAELQVADYILALIRLILQTALSTVLVFVWYKDREKAAPFAAVDILKLFVTSLCTTLLITVSMLTVVLLPLGIWLYLRLDFYMNTYITGRSNGIFSCVGESFRVSKGHAGRYFVFNLKYLLFYFVIEFAATILMIVPGFTQAPLPGGVQLALDWVDPLIISVFMPYRYLLKCGFYDTVIKGE